MRAQVLVVARVARRVRAVWRRPRGAGLSVWVLMGLVVLVRQVGLWLMWVVCMVGRMGKRLRLLLLLPV